ncbi:MAG: ribonuclease R [Clostridia bacterium]|nr:ribonuclease R [Clostridia bacterium]MBT7121662.1 ribonuclease R [Clostridia bacterium]
MEIREHILAVLADNKNKIEFETLLKGTEEKPGSVREAVRALISEGKVMSSKNGKLFLPGSFGMFTGRLEVKRLGFAFLLDEDGDIFVSADNKAGAMNGDLVAVRMLSGKQTHRKREGKVVQILGSEERRVVGLLSGKFIVPDDERMDDVYVPKKYMSGAKSGQKVVAAIVKRAAGDKSPEGKIVEVLGDAGVNSVEILSYIKRFDLPEDFSQEVEYEAKAAAQRKMSSKGRLDLRKQTVFTIDGESAKDLDDAVSIKKLPQGYELGVHIADVAHYVLEGTKLDKEAQERGTSVYLADFVIPMLPKSLSNGICSLTQGEDRLTLSCIMTIEEDGRISHSKISESVIRSKHRMTYNDVNAIFDGQDKKLQKKYKDIVGELKHMKRLAKIMRKRREVKGSIDFELNETEFKYDADGHVIDLLPRERGVAERLIEEFMLAANRTVAEEYFWREIPFVYRVHEKPDEDKMKAFGLLCSNLGYRIKGKLENVHPKMLQKVLSDLKGTPHENIINQIMLRSLKKAEYLSECNGHFGLSFEYYCHFTSPIRRYPDLAAHRIIKHDIGGRLTLKYLEELDAKIDEICKNSSLRERAAMQAERQVDDMKKAEYMMGKEGRVYDGVVSGVMRNVIFVELDNTVEGVIPLSSLSGDYYVFDENNYCVVGERTGKRISLGDEKKIRVVGVSVFPPRIEFEPAK